MENDENQELRRSKTKQGRYGLVDDRTSSSSRFVLVHKFFGVVPWDADKRCSCAVSLCFMLSMNLLIMAYEAFQLISNILAGRLEMVPHRVALVTDLAIAFGATAAHLSFRVPSGACEAVNMQDKDSQKHWQTQAARDALMGVVLWMLILAGRSLAMFLLQTSLDTRSILHVMLFSLSTGTLLGACHLLVNLTRGIKTLAEHLVFLLCSSAARDSADIKENWKII